MRRWGSTGLCVLLVAAAFAAATYLEPAWRAYVAALLGLLAGLCHDRFGAIYHGDETRLERMNRRGRPAATRDYLSLRRMAYRLVRRGGRTAIVSAEVSQHADRLARRLGEQETIVHDAAASMQAISTAISQVSASASQVSELASRSRDASQESREALDQVIGEMADLAARSDDALALLETLSRKSESVRDVTGLIEEIAEQTNLLSLNASIEAARAGEHGRGFAVVAGEVRNLAKRTAEATKRVESQVDEIGDSSQKVVDNIGHLMRRVGDRAKDIEAVGERLNTMTRDFDVVDTEIAAIAVSMNDTRGHSQQVSETLGVLQTHVDDGNRDMHALAEQAQTLMQAAEEVEGELAQQRLDSRHQQVFTLARKAADRIGAVLTGALKSGELSERDLFEIRYLPIPGTNPPKYHTAYDSLTDRHLPDIQDPVLETLDAAYAMTCDRRGYVPTHNRRSSRPPTGDYETDLKYSRQKRLFDDATGGRCGNHDQPLLVQTYKRDTGEVMHDLSVPVYVAGRHWGGFRIGYHPVPPEVAAKSAPTSSTTSSTGLAQAPAHSAATYASG